MTTTSQELRLRLIDAERDANATWPLLAAEGKEQARKLRARIARRERDQVRRDRLKATNAELDANARLIAKATGSGRLPADVTIE